MKSIPVLAFASGFTLVTTQTYPIFDPSTIDICNYSTVPLFFYNQWWNKMLTVWMWCYLDINTKEIWCIEQEASCEVLFLGGSPETNTCSADDLQYSCICTNGLPPDTTVYVTSSYREHMLTCFKILPYTLCTLHSECRTPIAWMIWHAHSFAPKKNSVAPLARLPLSQT